MTNVIGIIGAGHGDEGKGLITDYFAYEYEDSVIVRYNSSAQPGHTVLTPDGKRHVFSHLGSGSFVNRPTLLSEFVVCHPLIFKREHLEFKLKHDIPVVYVHVNCSITTPIDMIINQIMEIRRGHNGRHGSVGLGFNETIERSLIPEFKLTALDLRNGKDYYTPIIEYIRHNWLEKRLPKIDNPCDKEIELLNALQSDYLWFDYINAIEYFLDHVTIIDNYCFDWETIIFEGAQGLLLDQDYGTFPHVTRSNTGVKNILKILDHIDNIESIDVYYITRAYATRHGHGPLFGEQELPYDIVDETNKPHDFQGVMRHAPLSFNILYDAIFHDYDQLLNSNKHYVDKAACQLVVTCLDQIKDVGLCFDYMDNDLLSHIVTKRSGNEFIDILLDQANIVSYGPTREDVVINDPLLYIN